MRSVTYRSEHAIVEDSIYRHDPGSGWEWATAPRVLGVATEAPPERTLEEVLAEEMRALQESLEPFSGPLLAEDPRLRKDPSVILSYRRTFSLPESIRYAPTLLQIVDKQEAPASRLPLHLIESWNERLNAFLLL